MARKKPIEAGPLEGTLWGAADELRANSKLKASEYSVPVLGLIFLRYADQKFSHAEKELAKKATGRRKVGKTDFHARGVLYLPKEARFSHLLNLPEEENIGKAINEAMKAIEAKNPDLKDVLPKTYNRLENATLIELIKLMSSIPMDIEGDAFGKIYEYFLGKFAMAEGQKGGEFFTPTSLVRLIVEIIEPFHGRVFDPCCGSGGMFVQSARFVGEHANNAAKISVYGQERVAETVRLCKMNLAVHGLAGDIRQGNTYYEDLHTSPGKFDFVMANPPFNVKRVDKERIKDDPRFRMGVAQKGKANYLWIQVFWHALRESGRAGFVMANSASDSRVGQELSVRRSLIEQGVVDVMVGVASNFFYTVTLPCTLWFLDKGKGGTDREDKVLFIDARHIYRQIDRAHRDFSPQQLEFLANIVRLYRGEEPENRHDSGHLLKEKCPDGRYNDVPGLCKVATLEEIKEEGWTLNPSRYVGVAASDDGGVDFQVQLEELNEELQVLGKEARLLEERIAENVAYLLEEVAS